MKHLPKFEKFLNEASAEQFRAAAKRREEFDTLLQNQDKIEEWIQRFAEMDLTDIFDFFSNLKKENPELENDEFYETKVLNALFDMIEKTPKLSLQMKKFRAEKDKATAMKELARVQELLKKSEEDIKKYNEEIAKLLSKISEES